MSTSERPSGAAGWLVVLVLVGAAGSGGYYLMTKDSRPSAPSSPDAASSAAVCYQIDAWRKPENAATTLTICCQNAVCAVRP